MRNNSEKHPENGKKARHIDNIRKIYSERFEGAIGESAESSYVEAIYKSQVERLRSKFDIPSDLTNKSINIRYKQENGIYCNLYLYNDGMSLSGGHGKKTMHINKIGDSWNSSAYTSNERGLSRIESFSLPEFNKRIDDIIEHADICEIYIEELKSSRLPTKK